MRAFFFLGWLHLRASSAVFAGVYRREAICGAGRLRVDAFLWVGDYLFGIDLGAFSTRALIGREARRFGAQFCRFRWTGEIGTYERRAYAPTGQCEPFY